MTKGREQKAAFVPAKQRDRNSKWAERANVYNSAIWRRFCHTLQVIRSKQGKMGFSSLLLRLSSRIIEVNLPQNRVPFSLVYSRQPVFLFLHQLTSHGKWGIKWDEQFGHKQKWRSSPPEQYWHRHFFLSSQWQQSGRRWEKVESAKSLSVPDQCIQWVARHHFDQVLQSAIAVQPKKLTCTGTAHSLVNLEPRTKAGSFPCFWPKQFPPAMVAKNQERFWLVSGVLCKIYGINL